MEKIDFALIPDGSSDKTIIPILKWLLRQTFSQIPINGEHVDFSRFINAPKALSDKICKTIDLYHPNLLFVHRDAEAQNPQMRYEEIRQAIAAAQSHRPIQTIPYICVVPIRMTEAWLLFNEYAIRKAVGKPSGRTKIKIPALNRLEKISDPKALLFSNLLSASELRGRKKNKFSPEKCRYLIANYIEDYSPLFKLSAFQRLHEEIRNFAGELP